MSLTHINGHAALHLVPPPIASKLVNTIVTLGRPGKVRQVRASGEAAPPPTAPVPEPAASVTPVAPAGKQKGGRGGRPPRSKAPVAPQKPHAAHKAGKAGSKATPGKPARKSNAEKTEKASKKQQVLALLRRPHGASLAELMQATGWQSHSVRGFLSGTLRKKMALNVKSAERADGVRVYSLRG